MKSTALLAGTAATLLVGCSASEQNDANPSTTQTATIALVFDEGGRGDKSFNDSAARGLDRAKEELDVATREVDSRSQGDYRANFETLASDSPDLIIGVGMSMNKALHDVARDRPNQMFMLVDMPSELPNVRGVVFKEHEGSFLAGIVAGLTTKTDHLGFVGGKSGELIERFEAGFRAGVKAVNPEAVVTDKYTEDWSDIAKGKEAALALFDAGADIVYHAAGACGIGVISAAKERDLFAIGVDSNQDGEAPGNVLTSMVKRVDNAVFLAAKAARDGTFAGGTVTLGLADGGVGITDMEFTRHLLPEGAEGVIAAAERGVKSGEIIVPASLAELSGWNAPVLPPLD